MITAAQIRAGRGLTSLAQKEFAEKAGVSVATLRRMESDEVGPSRSSAGAVESVRSALEAAGVEFIPENGGGAGVRLAQRDG